MNALLLEKNGRISSSKRTKHIKAKYFLVKDYYESEEIDFRYCPTDIMWADVLTKPLQGQKFRDMRAFLQNCPRGYDDDIELQNDPLAQQTMNHQVTTNVSLQECVGEHSHSKARHVSQSTVEIAQNVPVHFGSKVRRSVETAQNVPVLFGSKDETIQNVPVNFGSQSPVKTAQNVSVHFGSKVRRPVEGAQNVPVHFGSKLRKCPKCTTTFNKPDEQVLAK
jgi:hypothetical protein